MIVSVIGLPRLGIYSKIIRQFFESLGCEVVQPSKVSQDIINPGVMNSADMMCYPYKVTLGQEIWALEHGATDLVMFNTHGRCRFKHYHQLQEQTLRGLGYKFRMHALSVVNFLPMVTQLSGHLPKNTLAACLRALRQIVELERRAKRREDGHRIRIGLVGELYTMIEPDINFDIVRKLDSLGVSVDVSLTISEFIKNVLKLNLFEKRAEKAEAKSLLREKIGGHGFQSIYNTIWYAKQGYDGVIHLMPLSCMPESTVEVLLDQVARKYNVPLYRFPIDESSFEVGFSTRLETFVSMLKRRKNAKNR